MFSPALEAELEAFLGPNLAAVAPPPVPAQWASIRANAGRIALEESKLWHNGGRKENDSRMQASLLKYWAAVGGPPATTKPLWETAWSAAFISWVLKQAGAGPYFQYAAAHRYYVHRAVHNALKYGGHPVQAHPVERTKPRVGDLVCYWRESRPLTIADLVKIPVMTEDPQHQFPLHCDIVTEVEPKHLWSVGGNVSQSVGRTRRDLTNGLLDPMSAPNSPNPKTGWLAVVRIGP